MGEQSVSAIMPIRRSVVSGPSPIAQLARLFSKPAPPSSAAAPPTNARRDMVLPAGGGSVRFALRVTVRVTVRSMDSIVARARFPALFVARVTS
jgi:hypothetical protein